MPRPRLLLLAFLALAVLSGERCDPDTRIIYDPYQSVNWNRDVRCKAQLHDHIEQWPNRLQAYDDAGYCAVALMHYTGVPDHPTAWTEAHWPPEEWFAPAFLDSFESIKVLIPGGEHIGWTHITSPFLETYLECFENGSANYENPLCAQAGYVPRRSHHYSSDQELVAKIEATGALASVAHPVRTDPELSMPPYVFLPTRMMELCSSHMEYRDWQCDNTENCSPDFDDAPAKMRANYDAQLQYYSRTWATCVNDWFGPFRDQEDAPDWIFDSGYQIILAAEADAWNLRRRMIQGAMFAVQDRGIPKGNIPQIQRIWQNERAIYIQATDWYEIRWIRNGQRISYGPLIFVDDMSPGTLRAEIMNAEGSIVFTQPWDLR